MRSFRKNKRAGILGTPASYSQPNVGPCTVLLRGIVGETSKSRRRFSRNPSEHDQLSRRKSGDRSRFRDAGEDLPPASIRAGRKGSCGAGSTKLSCRPKAFQRRPSHTPELADQAAERIYHARQRARAVTSGQSHPRPYNPRGSTRRQLQCVEARAHVGCCQSHVNAVVCDSSWEAELAASSNETPTFCLRQEPGGSISVPYRDGSISRKYLPDFIVRLDGGGDEPLNLVLEVKGAFAGRTPS